MTLNQNMLPQNQQILLGQLLQFFYVEKVSHFRVRECIPNSAPKSCHFDPIHSKLLIECPDSSYSTFQPANRPSHSSEIAPLKVVNDLFLSLSKATRQY